MTDRVPHPPDLRTRVTLTVPECASALGISERTLRANLPGLPTVRIGTRVLIPVRALEQWILERIELKGNGVVNPLVEQISKEMGLT